ncbi:MAG: NAD-dependent epimerase/dehydratase family protein [Nitrospinae bacterium]|nr:NAD-dependent epimerase/dehydratase family protein [Nitrospinota bacterium]
MDTALVTGGAGFIGSHLVEKLLGFGLRVRVLDNLSTGHVSNLPISNRAFSLIEGDIRDPLTVRKALEGMDALFHLAALSSVPRSLAEPLETGSINLGGTITLLEAARDCGVKRFVFTSSAAVYGDVKTLPVREDSPLNPTNPYGADKMACEQHLSLFSRQHGIKTFAFRLFNVYGPRQNPDSPYSGVVSRFIATAIKGWPVEIFGDGRQTRDFVFVSDVVDVLAKSLEMPVSIAEPVNVGSGEPTSLLRLAETLEQVLGRSIEKVFKEPRAGDIIHSVASIERLRSVFGVKSLVSLADGLRETVNSVDARL